MKFISILTMIIALAFNIQLVTAGSITDTYTSGDTLTTTTLDNIKTAVNDNDTRTGGVDFINSSLDIAVTSTASTILSVAVTAPADGFVIVSFSSTARLNHVNGTNEYMRLWLADSPTSNTFDETWRYHRAGSALPSDTYWVTLHSQKVFEVNAGTTTFYARGDSSASGGTYRNSTLHAIFVPNRY